MEQENRLRLTFPQQRTCVGRGTFLWRCSTAGGKQISRWKHTRKTQVETNRASLGDFITSANNQAIKSVYPSRAAVRCDEDCVETTVT